MATQSMLESMEGVLSTSTKVLLRRDCALSKYVLEGVLCVLELLEGVRCIMEAYDVCYGCWGVMLYDVEGSSVRERS